MGKKGKKDKYAASRSSVPEKLREWVSGLSVWSKIFAVAAAVVFFFGIFTIGAFNGTGSSVTLEPESEITIAYRLSYESGQVLDGVYINVGTVYESPGGSSSTSTSQVRAYYGSSGSSSSAAALSSTAYIANIYSTNTSSTYKNNANYNWLALSTGNDYTYSEAPYVYFTFASNRAAVQLNEVAFVDADGDTIDASVFSSGCVGLTSETIEDLDKTLDAQFFFHPSDSFRYTFTYDEEYILESVRGIELGSSVVENYEYTMSTDYNSLGILIYALFYWIFGRSTFGLRLPSFLSAFGVFLLLYFFGRKLFKSDKWGFVLAASFGIGGTLFGVGRIGTPMMLAIFLVLLSIWFMYRFYAKGIDSARPIQTALPILWSGLCTAGAFCVQTLAVFPCLVSLVLFVCGLLRLAKHRGYQISKVEHAAKQAARAERRAAAKHAADTAEKSGQEASPEAGPKQQPAPASAGTSVHSDTEGEIRRIDRDYYYKLRISFAFFLCTFLSAIVFMALAGAFTNGAFARYYDETNFFAFLGYGITQCFSVGDISPLTSGNSITSFSWFFSMKGATVAVGDSSMINLQINVLMAYAAAVAFVFSTAYVIVGLVKGQMGDKRFRQVLRAYVGMGVGMIASVLPYAAVSDASSAQSGLFSLFYLSFIVLAFFIMEGHRREEPAGLSGPRGRAKRIHADTVALIVLFVLFAAVFILSWPMTFGWSIGTTATNIMFNWMSLFSNGQYGLLVLD